MSEVRTANSKLKSATMRLKGIGEKPRYGFTELSKLDIIRSLNYYSVTADCKDSKKWTLDWLANVDPYLEKALSDVKPYNFNNIGFICRMLMDGAILPDSIKTDLMTRLTEIKEENTVKTVKMVSIKSERINPIMERVLIAEDDITINNKIMENPFSVDSFTSNDLHETFIHCFANFNNCELFPEVYKDDRITTLKTFYEFCMIQLQLLESTPNRDTEVKPEKTRKPPKPRVKKLKTPAELTKKVPYQKNNTELGFDSINIQKIIGAKKAVLYDTKKRKIFVLEASNQDGIMIKGMTIENCNPVISKIVRKPDVLFAAFKSKSPSYALSKNMLKTLSTTEQQSPAIRFNDCMMIIGISN